MSPTNTTYDDHCAACHQADGQGIPEAYPKLAGSPLVNGDSEKVIQTVLNGRGQMPAFRDQLDDEAIVDVITYVRGSWGNHGGPVTAANVKASRAGK